MTRIARTDEFQPFPKPEPKAKKRKGMNRVSAKRKARRTSDEGQSDTEHLLIVKTLPCCACGRPGPSEAHHCKDQPSFDMRDIYTQLPCAGRKSGHKDTIPLCPECHRNGPNAYHVAPAAWRERHGPDWSHIAATRAAVAAIIEDQIIGDHF